mmetsp:Transcript_22003/g.38981  ORF Transcript_22003/g.38981 Transcript_22003/m.38981 type:complete len:205 (+) Transcript_22003:1186-1800(+)
MAHKALQDGSYEVFILVSHKRYVASCDFIVRHDHAWVGMVPELRAVYDRYELTERMACFGATFILSGRASEISGSYREVGIRRIALYAFLHVGFGYIGPLEHRLIGLHNYAGGCSLAKCNQHGKRNLDLVRRQVEKSVRVKHLAHNFFEKGQDQVHSSALYYLHKVGLEVLAVLLELTVSFTQRIPFKRFGVPHPFHKDGKHLR